MEESKLFVKQFRAQNNFRAVAGHDERPKKFLIAPSLVCDRSKYKGGRGGGGSQLILVSFSSREHDCFCTKRQKCKI